MLVYSVKIPLEGGNPSPEDKETVRQCIQKLLCDNSIMPEDAEFFPLEIQVETEPYKNASEQTVEGWEKMHAANREDCEKCGLIAYCDGSPLVDEFVNSMHNMMREWDRFDFNYEDYPEGLPEFQEIVFGLTGYFNNEKRKEVSGAGKNNKSGGTPE